ncbi:hypothetical protein NET02_10155 [Thermomicrobiaceae bacterium CFH 74404]|uniref:Uncharacterized protein n=1 Tax=Thermalbibacter longus TaxID=2951981 RepID=A0AA41WGA1_9BACT|nr:hypothetical protein [Thermalbibacter longus]MCM8749510.1 hypothetical protein [Thermalbibacter longus]
MTLNPLLSELMVEDRRNQLLERAAQERRAALAVPSLRQPGRVRQELGHALMRLGARVAGVPPAHEPSPVG